MNEKIIGIELVRHYEIVDSRHAPMFRRGRVSCQSRGTGMRGNDGETGTEPTPRWMASRCEAMRSQRERLHPRRDPS